jgi:hypothetical protein
MSMAPAEKAVATKRKDRGFGRCKKRGCKRPAAERKGLCVEHRAGVRAAETLRNKGEQMGPRERRQAQKRRREIADKAHATRQRREKGWWAWTDEERAAYKKERAAARKKRWGF